MLCCPFLGPERRVTDMAGYIYSGRPGERKGEPRKNDGQTGQVRRIYGFALKQVTGLNTIALLF